MTAYEEFAQEKRAIDALLEQGCVIVGIQEGLDGTDVRFGGAESLPERTNLRLLSADARKYIVSVMLNAPA